MPKEVLLARKLLATEKVRDIKRVLITPYHADEFKNIPNISELATATVYLPLDMDQFLNTMREILGKDEEIQPLTNS